MTTQEPRPTDAREGTWTRLELMRMNARFVAAMECALAEEEERERVRAIRARYLGAPAPQKPDLPENEGLGRLSQGVPQRPVVKGGLVLALADDHGDGDASWPEGAIRRDGL